jgi:hypothetical protein
MRSYRSTGKMAKGEERKKIPLVPENLKKRKAYQALKATQTNEEFWFKQLESFLRDSWRQQRDKVRARRLEVKPRALEVSDKHSLAFVGRIQRTEGVSLLVKKTIARLRLKKLFSGVLVSHSPKRENASCIGTLCDLGISKSEVCPRTHLETWTSKG